MTAVISVGAIAGTVSLNRLQDATTVGGTYADIAGATAVDITATGVSIISVDVRSIRRFIKYAATAGGTTLIGVTLIGYKKYMA